VNRPINVRMDANLKKAFPNAGIKLMGGLLLVVGFIGVGIVTPDPDGIQSQLAELEAVEEQMMGDAASRGEAAAPVADDSLIARVRSVISSRVTSGPDLDRFVSCRLDGGGIRFMRSGDCRSRGGQSKDFDPEH
jgi:hypothetical protein